MTRTLCRKSIRPDLVQALLEAGDIGPLLDHLSDEGASTDDAWAALYEARHRIREPLWQLVVETYDRMQASGYDVEMREAHEDAESEYWALDARVSRCLYEVMDAYRRRDKAFDSRVAVRMFEEGDVGVLLDYLDDEGITDRIVVGSMLSAARHELIRPYREAHRVARQQRDAAYDAYAEQEWETGEDDPELNQACVVAQRRVIEAEEARDAAYDELLVRHQDVLLGMIERTNERR